MDIRHDVRMQIGGWFGVFVAAIAYYIAFAELTNECYRKASRAAASVSMDVCSG